MKFSGMIHFLTRFEILQPLAAFPRPLMVGYETVSDASYRFQGRSRGDASHGIFQFTLEGCGEFSDAKGVHRLPAGQGFLCEATDPDTAYGFPPGQQQPWSFVFLAFQGQAALDMLRDLVQRHGAIYQLSPDKRVIRRLLGYKSYEQVGLMLPPSEGAQVVHNVLLELAASKEGRLALHPENILVQRAREAIRELLNNNVNVADIARILEVSREHLTRIFHQQMGLSPYQYIVREKMLLACRLLKQTDLSVKEIGWRFGFETPAHFSRSFKRIIRLSPSEFREIGNIPML
jgi:AraC-like DNA-binding protein